MDSLKKKIKSTNVDTYLHRSKIGCFIIIAISLIISIVSSFFVKDIHEKLYVWGIALVTIMYQFYEIMAVMRTASIIRIENAKSLFDSIDKVYDLLVLSWKEYNVREAEGYKSKWDEIVFTAEIMRDRGTISKEVYDTILKSNVEYTHKETEIRLENMRNR